MILNEQPQVVVFTDLDGTLLDHHNYDYSPALPAIKYLKQHKIPIVPVSSKTISEIQYMSESLQFDGPVVAENGAVIKLPENDASFSEPDYQQIRLFIDKIRTSHGYQMKGFGDMSIQEVVDCTGLGSDEASRAMERQGSEPFLWHGSDSELQVFTEQAFEEGMQLLKGGRFYHLMGLMDKGKALNKIKQWYQDKSQHQITSIALGDSGNDYAMLKAADIAVAIKRTDGTHLEVVERDDVIKTEECGPEGWNNAIQQIMCNIMVQKNG
jgi:mannosyl-3-phosphoglycerate phosphatase